MQLVLCLYLPTTDAAEFVLSRYVQLFEPIAEIVVMHKVGLFLKFYHTHKHCNDGLHLKTVILSL